MPDRFNYVKKGYDPEQVDNYIDTLEQVVKSYKDKDSTIKNAIISAQMAADNIIKNAHLLVAESRTQALAQIQNIISSISEQRNKVKEFQEEYVNMVQKYLIDFNETDMNRLYNKITELEQLIARAAYIAPSTSSTSAYAATSATPNPSTHNNTSYISSAQTYAAATSGSVAFETDFDSEES